MFPQVTYPVVIWGLFAGIAAAAIGAFASRFRAGLAVRTLIEKGAASPESAMTAAELGLSGGAARALRGALCGKLFVCANESEALTSAKHAKDQKKRLDPDKARFYLPEERQDEAASRFPRSSPVALIVALALLAAGFAALHVFLPTIVDFVTKTFGK